MHTGGVEGWKKSKYELGGKVVKGLSMRGKKTSGVLERKKTFPCLTSSRLACWSSQFPKVAPKPMPKMAGYCGTLQKSPLPFTHSHVFWIYNSLQMWQQQMTSNHKSSQITQITCLQKKMLSCKSQDRRKGSR